MSSDAPHSGLNADPARQAVGSLQGYAYQIWRSVLEWMTMQEDEAIDLEGNEDIDRLYPGGAESTQVKDTAGSGPVTLRSGDVIEAINNYWKARQRNVGVKLSMRFLSTAGVTGEKEKPFGERHGLRVWQSVQRRTNPPTDEADAILLRDFLLQVPGLDAGLKTWLASAHPAAIIEELIVPVHWDLEADGTDTILEAIDGRLVTLGETYRIFPKDAVRVRPRLLQEVLSKATRAC